MRQNHSRRLLLSPLSADVVLLGYNTQTVEQQHHIARLLAVLGIDAEVRQVVDGVDSLDMNRHQTEGHDARINNRGAKEEKPRLNNRDAMGDVYEYILGKMAASGTNGQFRTPRHIIRMIVEMMEPTPQDYICDPAMGSYVSISGH